MKIYLDFRDWWIGYYRGPDHHYACPIPCLVVRWERKEPPTMKITIGDGPGTIPANDIGHLLQIQADMERKYG